MPQKGLVRMLFQAVSFTQYFKVKLSLSAFTFHGNNKSSDELELAIKNNVRIVVDNATELGLIATIAEKYKQQALVLFRIKPGIEAHTHEYIKTGHIDSKFGLTFEETLPLIQQVIASDWGTFLGIHAHIGSQIFDMQPFYDLVSILVDYVATIKDEFNYDVLELNCGGGFGIQYKDSDNASIYLTSSFKGNGVEIAVMKNNCHIKTHF